MHKANDLLSEIKETFHTYMPERFPLLLCLRSSKPKMRRYNECKAV
jgi:hypothetical protein